MWWAICLVEADGEMRREREWLPHVFVGGWGEWIKAPKEKNFSAISNFLPVSKLSIHTADSSGHSNCKVIIKIFREKVEPADLQRNAAFKFIVTKQPGK
jgi:hypothetical protein